MLVTSFNPTRLPRKIRDEFGPLLSWDDASQEHTLAFVRFYRDLMLKDSDWTQVSDSPLTSEKKAEWATYRQELRDITATYQSNYKLVNFPDKPN